MIKGNKDLQNQIWYASREFLWLIVEEAEKRSAMLDGGISDSEYY